VHSFACALRELHDVSDKRLPDLMRNLILDILIVTGQTSDATSTYFKQRATFIVTTWPEESIEKLDSRGMSELDSLLAYEEIKGIYLSICQTVTPVITADVYTQAQRHFMDNIYLSELLSSLMIYGITLTGRQVIIDNTELGTRKHRHLLQKAYILLILLHEFSHFLLRASTKTIQEFLQWATPPETELRPSAVVTRVRQIIKDNFPINYHGEAGNIFEEKLFGAKLKKVNIHSAKVLMEMAKRPKALRDFTREFNDVNKIRVKPGQMMGLERGG